MKKIYLIILDLILRSNMQLVYANRRFRFHELIERKVPSRLVRKRRLTHQTPQLDAFVSQEGASVAQVRIRATKVVRQRRQTHGQRKHTVGQVVQGGVKFETWHGAKSNRVARGRCCAFYVG